MVRFWCATGLSCFIIVEVMFFVAWFWAFFKHALLPDGYLMSTPTTSSLRSTRLDPFPPAAASTRLGPAVVRQRGHLVAPCAWCMAAPRKGCGQRPDHSAVVLRPGSSTGLPAFEYWELIAPLRLDLRRRQVLPHLLPGHRLSRRAGVIVTIFLVHLLAAGEGRTLHRRKRHSASRRRLVLALRRRGVAVPVPPPVATLGPEPRSWLSSGRAGGAAPLASAAIPGVFGPDEGAGALTLMNREGLAAAAGLSLGRPVMGRVIRCWCIGAVGVAISCRWACGRCSGLAWKEGVLADNRGAHGAAPGSSCGQPRPRTDRTYDRCA